MAFLLRFCSYCNKNMIFRSKERRLWKARLVQQSPGCRYTDPKALNETESSHRLCQIGVAVVSYSVLAESAGGNRPKGPPGLMTSIRSSNQLTRTGALVDSYVRCITALRVIC